MAVQRGLSLNENLAQARLNRRHSIASWWGICLHLLSRWHSEGKWLLECNSLVTRAIERGWFTGN